MMAHELSPEKRFVRSSLPWVVAAGALVLYLATLNGWVALRSLAYVADLSGWMLQPNINEPLYWLVTYPIRLLPLKAIPLALNLFSALCAALTLALLARSVALLPHDRTEDQRIRERSPFSLLTIPAAWLPPLIAVLACGLQLTFWEHATAGSSEMLNLLLFAYVIRCVLEFRMDGRDSWLLRSSLVYGAAMTGNWAMIGFFPLFLVALVWVKGVSFFNGRFLGRMFLLGLAGLSLYLLLPLTTANADLHVGFWPTLKANLVSQKRWLLSLPLNKAVLLHGRTGDQPLWVLALPSLLPILVLSIRWPSYFGDPSKLGVSLTTLVFHFVHGVLLLVCLWVAMDPEKFGPRHLVPGLPMLPLYYLGALSIGYFIGYFLLVFGTKPVGRPRPVPPYQPLLNVAVVCATWALAVLGPLLLLYRNLPHIGTTNGRMVRQYADLLADGLPPQGAYVLSDDWIRLFLLQSALTQKGRANAYPVLQTDALLKAPAYHKFLKRKYPNAWPFPAPKEIRTYNEKTEAEGQLALIIGGLARTNLVYYLHPSFGYYFEQGYAEPHGLVYKLTPYPTNSLLMPPLRRALMGENEGFWSGIETRVTDPLIAAIRAPDRESGPRLNPSAVEVLLRRFHLETESNPEAVTLGAFYSRSLNHWGVRMQRNNHLVQASLHFRRALDLNPENVVARINLEFNHNLMAGRSTQIEMSKRIEDDFGKYRAWDDVMNWNGPFDEPKFCLQQGIIMARNGGLHQAAEELSRVASLASANLESRLWLAQTYVQAAQPDQALQVVREVRARPEPFGLNRTNEVPLAWAEATAHLERRDLPAATNVFQAALAKYPGDEALLLQATKVFSDFGYYTNALVMLDEMLRINPGNVGALFARGNVCMQLKDFSAAIQNLSKVIDSETNDFSAGHYMALLFRAQAYSVSDKLDQAQSDYETIQKAYPTEPGIYQALGEIAVKKKDTNGALRNFQLYLDNVITNAVLPDELNRVRGRMKELRAAAH